MNFATDKPMVVERRRNLPQGPGAYSPQPHPTQTFRPEIVRSLREHQRIAAIAAGIVFVLVMGCALTRTASYKSESLIYVEPLATKVLSDGTAGVYDPARYDTYLQQQVQTVMRNDILAAAIDSLPSGTWKQAGESEDSAVGRLQDALKVQRVLTSYQISISLTTDNAEKAAAVVNAVASAYLDQGRKDSQSRANPKVQLLTEERQRIQTELEQDKAEQAALSSSIGVANPAGEAGNPYDVQLAGVRTQLATAREAHDIAAAQLSSVSAPGGLSTQGLAAAADEEIAGDAGLSTMKSAISSRRALLSSQMAGLTQTNPMYKQDQNEIADLDRALDKMTLQLRAKAEVRLQDKLRLDLRRTGDVEARLNAQLAQQTAAATSAAPKLQRATELAADMQRLSARYASVDDAIRGLELEVSGPGPANLALAASVPAQPEASKRKLLMLLALPLALLAGIAAAVIARKRDKHIYIGDDIASVLGFVPIGIVPARHEASDSSMDGYALRLAAGLEGAYRTGSARTFLFTAVSETTEIRSCVLAIRKTLRQLGFKVIAIDVTQLLRTGVHVQRYGAVSMNPTAASLDRRNDIGRDSIAAANIERMKHDQDLILVCAPALLGSATTEYAARCVDATMLIAECGVTQREELSRAAALLQRLHVSGVGAILQGLHTQQTDRNLAPAIIERERNQEESTYEPESDYFAQARHHAASAPEQGEAGRIAEELKNAEVPASSVASTVEVSLALEVEANTPQAVWLSESPHEAAKETITEPEPSWVQRLFLLQEQPVLKILPDEGHAEAPVATNVHVKEDVPEVLSNRPAAIMASAATSEANETEQAEMGQVSFAPALKQLSEGEVEAVSTTMSLVALPEQLSTVSPTIEDEWGWMSGKTFAMAPVPYVSNEFAKSQEPVQPMLPLTTTSVLQPASTELHAIQWNGLPSALTDVVAEQPMEASTNTTASLAADPGLRPALAKAAARSLPISNAPVRAADGLTARREEIRQRSELLAQQGSMSSSLRSASSTSAPTRHRHHPEAAVLSRRWHMLSRFDHGQFTGMEGESFELATATGN